MPQSEKPKKDTFVKPKEYRWNLPSYIRERLDEHPHFTVGVTTDIKIRGRYEGK